MARLIYTIADRKNKKPATTEVKLPDAFGLAALSEWAVSFATLLNNFIQGRILDAELCFDVDISAIINNDILLNNDVESVGRFEFVTAQGNRVKVNLPGIDDTFTIDGSDALDQADPAVAAFITLMETGYTLGDATVVQPSDVGEDDIVDTLFAREGSRASGGRSS